MHNNRNNRETVIIPQTIIVPTKSIIVASLAQMHSLHKSTETGRHQKEETKHFKDRHPDQMKEFKQVSLNLIFNI